MSRLNCSRSTTQGFCVLLFFPLPELSLSLSLSLSLFFASSSSSGFASRSTTTSRLPSGAHSKSSTSCAVSVSFCASPPCRFNSQTWVFPSLRAESNARYLPSGLHRGCDDETSSAVSAIASPPAAGTIQIRSSFLSSARLTEPMAYATHWPSGLICGSCRSRNANRSVMLTGRGAAADCCPHSGEPQKVRTTMTDTANQRNEFMRTLSDGENLVATNGRILAQPKKLSALGGRRMRNAVIRHRSASSACKKNSCTFIFFLHAGSDLVFFKCELVKNSRNVVNESRLGGQR